MPKVKIIYTQYSGDYYDNETVVGGLDWEEVTNEELSLLQKYAFRLPSKFGGYPKLVVQGPEPIAETIMTIKEFIEKEKREDELRKKKNAEAAKKAKKRRLENKRKQLEKLKKELGES